MIDNIAIGIMGVGAGMILGGMHNSGFIVFSVGMSFYALDQAVVTNKRVWWGTFALTVVVIISAAVKL